MTFLDFECPMKGPRLCALCRRLSRRLKGIETEVHEANKEASGQSMAKQHAKLES